MKAQRSKPLPSVKTPKQVKDELAARGESVTAWCRKHDVEPWAAYRVLGGALGDSVKAVRGEVHRAAVLLGLKVGTVEPRVTA